MEGSWPITAAPPRPGSPATAAPGVHHRRSALRMLREGGGCPFPPRGPRPACAFRAGPSTVPCRSYRAAGGCTAPPRPPSPCRLRPRVRHRQGGVTAQAYRPGAPASPLCACAASWSARARAPAPVRAGSLVTRGLRGSSRLAGPAARGKGEAWRCHGDGASLLSRPAAAEPRPATSRLGRRQAPSRPARGPSAAQCWRPLPCAEPPGGWWGAEGRGGVCSRQ